MEEPAGRTASTQRRRRLLWSVGIGLVLMAILVNAVLALFRVVAPLLTSDSPTSTTTSPSAPAAPTPASPAPSPSTERASTVQLPGAGRDVVFAQSDAGIYRLDLASGGVVRTITPELTQFSSFVAWSGGVVSKTIDNDTGVVVRDGQQAQPLPTGLRPNGRLYPAARDHLWLVPEDATAGNRTAIKVDLDGRRVGTATIRLADEIGLPGPDQDGQLLLTNTGGVYQAGPAGVRRLSTGQLLAIGTHHLLVWDCDSRARCDVYRTDRATGRRTLLPVDRKAVVELYYQGDLNSASYYQGVLSPDGTHAVIAGPPHDDNERPVAVLDLTTGRYDLLPGSTTDVNPNAQTTWTANSRWLLALTDHQLRAYDTTTDTVRTLPIDEPLHHLTSAFAPGF